MINRVLRYSCISLQKALYDPAKHSYMDKKNLPLLYDSLWAVGKYPDYYLNNSVASRAYEPQIRNQMVDILWTKYQTKISSELIVQKGYRKWSRFLLKDAKVHATPADFLSVVLRRLAKSIIVKESRFTWPLEQRMRLELSLNYYETHTPDTVSQFFVTYNELIEELVLVSTLGYSPFISQEGSALERLYEEEECKSKFDVPKEHLTMVNALLVRLHE